MQVECRNRTFEVFTKAEAKKNSIKYKKNWRSAEINDWILTNDEKVLQVLGRRKYNKNRKKPVFLIRTGYGETATYRSGIFAVKQRDYEWDIRYKKNLSYNVKPTALQSAFIHHLVTSCVPDRNGMWKAPDLIDAYLAVYMDNNPSNALRRALAILRKDSVKKHMAGMMRDRFIDIDVDDDYIANKYKEFVEDDQAPANTRLQALNRVSELMGHVEKSDKTTEQAVFVLDATDKALLTAHQKKLPDKKISEIIGNG